jgi:aspartate-semialdehyde dehydrogenase
MKIGIVGATGAVGQEMISILEERKFPVTDWVPFGSARSEGKSLSLLGLERKVRVLSAESLTGCEVIFFDAGDHISAEWVPVALKSGALVVDSSATYRLDPSVVLAVPEVNGKEILEKFKTGSRLFAGPNCTTVPLTMVLRALENLSPLKRAVISTYQSVSGAGALAIDELIEGTSAKIAGKPFVYEQFAHPIAFNCIPHIGSFGDDGYTSEERKVLLETRKILGRPELKMAVTAIRVPTVRCHGESVTLEFLNEISVNDAKSALNAFPGIQLLDSPEEKKYPLNDPHGTGKDPVFVGRVRKDPSVDHGIQLWLISDNLRKGAALNAIQIAETLLPLIRSSSL